MLDILTDKYHLWNKRETRKVDVTECLHYSIKEIQGKRQNGEQPLNKWVGVTKQRPRAKWLVSFNLILHKRIEFDRSV